MSRFPVASIDPQLDLVLERVVDVPPELVWRAWTEPEQIKKWFTPRPWQTVECELELKPGGLFRTVMRSPEGQDFPNEGCYLEIVPNRRLVWTDLMVAGFRPAPRPACEEGGCPVFGFTGVIVLEPHGTGTKYTALAMHSNPESRSQHEAMGFQDGWGKALEQLVEVAKAM